MKYLKQYMIIGAVTMITSCSDFLDTAPLDALSPATTWKTEDDAQKFAIGCYGGNNYDTSSWEDGGNILYLDCGSDFGYNNFEWENYKTIGNGTMTPSGAVASFYDFSVIRRCNTFLEKVKEIPFSNEQTKNDLIGQVRTIRAYRYFVMNWWYGGVPVIDNYNSADEAKVPRKSEEEVKNYVNTELDTAIGELNASPSERGRIAKGAAMAIRMRSALYYSDYVKAKEMAEAIMNLKQYDLEPDYSNLFKVAGQDSKEIILAVQYVNSTLELRIGILVVFAILVAGISYREYIKAHTFTLSGNEQIQSITGTVKVSSPKDTEVIFIDVKTGVNYAIPYITSGASETIKLEKGKWYSVETGEGLTMSLVNVRIE